MSQLRLVEENLPKASIAEPATHVTADGQPGSAGFLPGVDAHCDHVCFFLFCPWLKMTIWVGPLLKLSNLTFFFLFVCFLSFQPLTSISLFLYPFDCIARLFHISKQILLQRHGI